METHRLTVGDLRKMLEGLPDDMPVVHYGGRGPQRVRGGLSPGLSPIRSEYLIESVDFAVDSRLRDKKIGLALPLRKRYSVST